MWRQQLRKNRSRAVSLAYLCRNWARYGEAYSVPETWNTTSALETQFDVVRIVPWFASSRWAWQSTTWPESRQPGPNFRGRCTPIGLIFLRCASPLLQWGRRCTRNDCGRLSRSAESRPFSRVFPTRGSSKFSNSAKEFVIIKYFVSVLSLRMINPF